MPIEFVTGDLFENEYAAQALAHGCNCQGAMGAGIASGFRDRYPDMFAEYRSRCRSTPRQFNLGEVWLWKEAARPWVFNLATQEGVWRSRASYEAIVTSLSAMRTLADAEGVTSIAIPRIGTGYGGLSWRKVRAIIEQHFADWPGRLVVYETFARPGEPVVPDATSVKRTSRPARPPRFSGRAHSIYCTNLDQSVAFYEQVLGAKPLPREAGTNPWYRLGSLRFTLVPNADATSPAVFPTHAMTMLWLEVVRLDQALTWLRLHKIAIVDEGDGQFLTIADPDGLLIEIWRCE